jgi:flagellar hook-associated protein 2
MASVTAGTGLVSGLNYTEIVESLIALDKAPVNLLTTDLNNRKNAQAAYTGLSATMLSLSLSVSALGRNSTLDSRAATSANESLVRAVADNTAVLGSYSFRPVRLAQTQRFTSAGYADLNTAKVGAGTISVKRGGFVATDTSLDLLNGGSGVARGKIRVTDRSGVAAVVDLGGTRTVGDVIKAINDNGIASVTASVRGDSIVLTDQSGSTTGSIVVQELAGGRTAADLGILGSVAASEKIGADIVRLGGLVKLSSLNDGLGVRVSGTQDDLRITLKDGGTIDVKLSDAKTIDDVINTINNDSENSSRVTAAISGDGDRIVLTDSTGGGGTLTVTALNGSKAAADLGILGSEQAGGVLTGKRVLAGLNSVLLKNLDGGAGIATPGEIQLTDRSGATATIDLTAAGSLGDVVEAINAAGLGIKAAVNDQGHGITLTDTTGASASNLIVADIGGGTTAADLNIAGSVAATTIKSGDLHQTYINENTLLKTLGGGAGVSDGQFRITDRAGNSTVLNITGTSYKTVGDLLAGINAGSAQVTATINATGDGIRITDNSGGGGSLVVQNVGNSKTATDLRIAGTGSPTIDGAFVDKIEIDADDTLNDVIAKIGAGGAPITASFFNVGGTDGFKLSISSKKSGDGGRLLIDSDTTSLNLAQTQEGLDAVVQLSNNGSAPVTFASSNNTFSGVISGLTVDIAGVSSTSVTINVDQSSDAIVDSMNAFVKSFNSLSDSLSKQTKFDTTNNTSAILQGDQTAVGMQSALLSFISKRYGTGGNAIRSFAQIGLTIAGGQLSLDESKLRAAVSSNAAAVKDFFGATDAGASAAMGKVIKSYTDSSTGVLFHKIDSLDVQQEALQARIDAINKSVEAKKTRLLNQFMILEKTLASLQTQQTALGSLATLASNMSSSRSNSSS